MPCKLTVEFVLDNVRHRLVHFYESKDEAITKYSHFKQDARRACATIELRRFDTVDEMGENTNEELGLVTEINRYFYCRYQYDDDGVRQVYFKSGFETKLEAQRHLGERLSSEEHLVYNPELGVQEPIIPQWY